MRSATMPFRLCACVLLALWAPSLQAFDSGSSGADGTLAPEEDVLVVLPEDGILNYSSVNIPAGVTVRFASNRANTPVRMLVSGDVDIYGTIDISGQNAAAVSDSGDGSLADDGMPGAGGPGGYAGGAGGGLGFVDANSDQAELRSVAGGFGKGPGGGFGARLVVNGNRLEGCRNSGGNYANSNFRVNIDSRSVCLSGGVSPVIAPYGTASVLPLIGGSGGGGSVGSARSRGIGGGGGGGAILIAASGTVSIRGHGRILANGGAANGVGRSGSGLGGGGSGGAVRIVATTIAGNGHIGVSGGRSGTFSSGGAGRIRLEAENLNYYGTIHYSSSTPGPVFISNRPRLGIASVASVTAPSAPSGSGDVTLTASSDPVQVSISAGNVPLGTTVSLRVVPDHGAAFTVQGVALAGTLADSSSTASVTLPAGHSVLYASASFRVEPSDTTLQSLYMPYTAGERVVAAELDGTSGTLSLLTESGREVLVETGLGG